MLPKELLENLLLVELSLLLVNLLPSLLLLREPAPRVRAARMQAPARGRSSRAQRRRDGAWHCRDAAVAVDSAGHVALHAAGEHAVDLLRAAGWPHTAVRDEGILVWTRLGLPVTFGMPVRSWDARAVGRTRRAVALSFHSAGVGQKPSVPR